MYYLQSRYYDPEVGRFINADAFASTGQGLLGNNMFAYCLNNPARYVDSCGDAAVDIFTDDGEIFDESDLYDRGGSGSAWDTFMQCLDDASSGLNAAMGVRNHSVSERHHLFSDKNKKYTPQYQEIADRYNYSLSQQENIVDLQGHHGRHTNAYHEFMLTSLRALEVYADGNTARFLEAILAIADYIRENPWLPYARNGGK